jgi:phosphoribosylamine--glycine ligase
VRVLVVGGGGREHAVLWVLAREDPSIQLLCAPGNAGTAELATNLPIAATELERLTEAVASRAVDLTIIGPEAPLAAGLADRLRAAGRLVVGPRRAAAQIEASKAFAKEVMARAGVPTAAYATFSQLDQALAYLDSHPEPVVVKASGLAGGKGAVVCATRSEARQAVRAMLQDGQFGDAGRLVVIEEFLEGEELSVLALTNGRDLALLPAAQDHKRLGEGDTGPNTGGMGAYSPVALATPALLERVCREVFEPALGELAGMGTPYDGILYAGLMIGPDGAPRVVEFNCRLGDPEAQAVLPLLDRGLLPALQQVARGEAPRLPAWNPDRYAVTTVLASRGYPDHPEPGASISLPETLPSGVLVFHAGTRRDETGALRAAGGRVLSVTAVAPSFAQARQQSRAVAEAIQFDGKLFRRDIGWREAARR